jgi:protein involved in polysaccharide export with SLBB domain
MKVFRNRLLSPVACFLASLAAGGVPSLFGQENAGAVDLTVPPRMQALDNTRKLTIGDRFDYRVLEEREDAVTLFVNGEGFVNFPLIGRVEAEGKTPFSLALEMKYMLEQDFFYQATVIIDARTDNPYRGRVNIIGEVRTNGIQPLPADASLRLSEMILRSGGFTDQADESRVALIREGGRDANGNPVEPGRTEYDIGAMLETGIFENDPFLIPNDLILVPKLEDVGGEVFVLGAVNAPGAYPITRDDLTVSRAILGAGGFARFAQDTKVNLVRSNLETGEKQSFTINVKSILEDGNRSLDMEIQAGDIIQVDEKVINF